MAEYIEREALLAKAKTLPLGRGELWTGGERPKFISLADVVKAPAADVVEVVRCRDCISHEEIKKRNGGVYIHKCSFFDIEITEDDFCSYGERRSTDG